MKIGDISGVWHIEEMSMWDEDYFNMEVQAYFKFDKDYTGEFQFGLVTGSFSGDIYSYETDKERVEFTWEGADECDEAFGFAWIKRVSKERLEGEIRFHGGDKSTFTAVINK